MNALDLARWQFGITTICHFLFVPLSIGLSLLIAIMQTAWFRTGSPKYLAMTRFWGKLFLINFAMGTVSGIVQEFQFGMNWERSLAIRRRRVRRTAGDGGDRRVLPGGHVHRVVDLRLGPASEGGWRRTRGCSTRSATGVDQHRNETRD